MFSPTYKRRDNSEKGTNSVKCNKQNLKENFRKFLL